MQVIRIIARVSCKVHRVSNYSDSPSPLLLLLGILYYSFDAATDCGHFGASTGFSCHLATSAEHRESRHHQLPLCALGLVSQSIAHATQRWQRAAGYTHSEQWRIGKWKSLRDSIPTSIWTFLSPRRQLQHPRLAAATVLWPAARPEAINVDYAFHRLQVRL